MESYFLEWLNLLGRWAHVITGIAWIGASFYFIWLDNHLEAPQTDEQKRVGVGGELWAVHGGGFYHSQKYHIAPPKLPENLHWFKWEAYTTWITGMFMLILMYWYQAEIYLIDPGVADLPKPVAIIIGLVCIFGGWKVYDTLCKSRFAKDEKTLTLILFAFLCVVAIVLCHLFSGRGAFIHFGAMLGTMMVGNVADVIMPGQRDLVAAKEQGREPDPMHGIRAKQRSVHNTYFTLPVLLVMISNHYAMAHSHPFNWLVLIGFTVAGAAIRVWFVQRHAGKASPWPLIIAGVILAAIAALLAPRPAPPLSAEAQADAPTLVVVHDIVAQRCASCHADVPTQAGFNSAPQGVVFNTEADTKAQAQVIYQQAVVTKAMPIGNLTGITDEERATLAAWYRNLTP